MKLKRAQDLMHEGAFLIQMNKSGDEKAWYLIPGGEIPNDVAEQLKAMANVVGSEDGLFPGISQTWKMKS